MEIPNKMEEIVPKPFYIAIGDILATVNCLKHLGNVDKFLAWTKSYHGIENNQTLFEGYKFTIETLVRMLFDQIAMNYSLHLSENNLFRRARFSGISITKLPNDCEKAIILRNIHSKIQHTLATSDWQSLMINFAQFQKEVLLPLDNIKRVADVSPQHRASNRETAINYASMFITYIFLNDTRRGLPHGYLPTMFEEEVTFAWEIIRKRGEYLKRVFKGYKYAVQFLWYCLLEQRLNDTSLIQLHKSRDWEAFDKFFESIQKEVIRPLENETGASLGFDTLVVLERPAKDIIANLIEYGPPERRLSEKHLLDRMFLWYDIELIDGSSLAFCGAAAFIPMLIGIVQLRKESSKDEKGEIEKVKIIKLVHGSASEHRRDYSYAILIELYGALSDASGWVLFYDCCSDAGSTSHWYKLAEEYIERYLKEDLVSVNEKRIDKSRFLNLMKHRLVSLTNEQMYEMLASKQKFGKASS